MDRDPEFLPDEREFELLFAEFALLLRVLGRLVLPERPELLLAGLTAAAGALEDERDAVGFARDAAGFAAGGETLTGRDEGRVIEGWDRVGVEWPLDR